jgi:sugar O-acyltransferase (sialic acid O-acetyltransferase NeuD family)
MTESLYIIGAGGHAKVVISIVRELNITIKGILDDDTLKQGLSILGVEVLGGLDIIENKNNVKAIIAIGDNDTRKRVAERFSQVHFISLIHPKAYVHPSVVLGKGSIVMAGAMIQPESIIGNHVIINTGTTIDHDCIINDYSHVAPGCHLGGDVTIGEGALAGIGSSFIQGINIGKWSVVGAGSVVIKEVDNYCLVKGIPARFDRYLNIRDQEHI